MFNNNFHDFQFIQSVRSRQFEFAQQKQNDQFSDNDSSSNEDSDGDYNDLSYINGCSAAENIAHNFDPDDFQKIHENLNCTVNDAMLIIYAFSIRHNLNWNAVKDLAILVNTIIGNSVLSPSKYIFKKKIGDEANVKPTTHFFCTLCQKYLGTEDHLKSSTMSQCPNCQTKIYSQNTKRIIFSPFQSNTKFRKCWNKTRSILISEMIHTLIRFVTFKIH